MMKRLNRVYIIFIPLLCAFLLLPEKAFSKDPYDRLEDIAEDLYDYSEDMMDEYKRYLDHRDRWEPIGFDLDLWKVMMRFSKVAERLERFVDDEKPSEVLETQYSTLKRRKKDMLRLMERVELNQETMHYWAEVNEKMDLLSEVFEGTSKKESEKIFEGLKEKKKKWKEREKEVTLKLEEKPKLSGAEKDFIREKLIKLDRSAREFSREIARADFSQVPEQELVSEIRQAFFRFDDSVGDLMSALGLHRDTLDLTKELRATAGFAKEIEKNYLFYLQDQDTLSKWVDIVSVIQEISLIYKLEI